MAEYRGRLVFAEAAATAVPGGGARGGGARVKNWLKRRVAGNPLGARRLGHHPKRTAAILQQAARTAPNLSAASRRDSLENLLHERLEALQREARFVRAPA